MDDIQRQFDEPLNWSEPNNTGVQNAPRIVRWYTASAVQETEGIEFESIWTPVRNFQSVISGAWMWKAKTVSDPSLEILPTTPAATVISRNIIFGNRIAYAPEYRLNIFSTYTFGNNLVGELGRGLRLSLGARYASEIVISNDQNFNASRGGVTAGDYVVWQSVIGVPFELLGYRFNGSLNIENLTDKIYSEGNFGVAAPRSYLFTLGLKF